MLAKQIVLVGGMVAGVVVAGFGLVDDPAPVVSEVDVERAAAGLPPALRARVRDKLLDEALLVERGIELGLARTDKQARAALTAAVIELVTARADIAEPDAKTLNAFHVKHSALFRVTERVHVRATHQGKPVPLPDAPVPPGKLRDYLGGSSAAAALTLPIGEPTVVGDHTLTVVSRRAGADRPFAEVRDLVLATWRQREADRALRTFLDAQRRRRGLPSGN